MIDEFEYSNTLDKEGNPAGGDVSGVGLKITWQDGPLGRGKDRKKPNGAFVETVIAAALKRLEFYQTTDFACEANAEAIKHLQLVLIGLDLRTREREARGVEGTHTI